MKELKSSEEDNKDEVNDDDNNDDDDNDDDVDKDINDDDVDNQDDENQYDDDDEQTYSGNDGDDFVHPKLSTHDDKARKDDEVNEDESNEESGDESNEESDKEVQGANTRDKEMDEEATHEEDEANGLYKDVNVNLEGRDTMMTNALLPNVQATQETEDTYVIITALINPKDVPVTTIVEPPLVSVTTLPPPPTPLIIHMQQTPVPILTTVLSSSLQDLPNFGSLFRFNHRLKTLETDFSEFKQTNQFAEAVSSIVSIVDTYLTNKMHEAVKTVVQLQSKRLRDEAQAENADFLNKLDDNIKKIIKDQVKEQVKAQVSKILPKIEKTVNEQLKAKVMTRSSTESKTSLDIAANLSELELKKILIEKMESNKLIHIYDEQKNLYKALVDAYKSDKLILDTYGDTVSFKRRRDDEDKDKEPSAGSNRWSKRRQARKEPELTSAPKEKTSKTSGKSYKGSKSKHKTAGESAQTEEPMHTTKDLEEPAHQEFKTGVTEDQPNEETPYSLAQKEDPRESFNELMDTPLDFSAFVMNRLKVDTLTPELLAGPTFKLMKGTCKSLVELEYFFEEVYKATIDQLDWHNPEGQQYPHDLRKPLPLIPNSRGRQVISFDHFINNDFAYLSGGISSQTYATSIMKTKAADYGHIKWIKDLVPNTMWSEVSEGDFKRLRLQDIEDMLIFLVQGKLTNLNVEDRLDFGVSLRMFTRSIVIQRRVKDLQLGVKSYQKKLNITKPDTYRSDLKRMDAYTTYSNPRGFIYQNKDKKNKLMRIDELHKFSDGTLDDVLTALNDRLKWIRMEYLPQTIWRQSDREREKAMIQAIDKQLMSRRIIRSL
ncbi:hypothetical protein Tco_1413464, partial [Tanacetum coccineum]